MNKKMMYALIAVVIIVVVVAVAGAYVLMNSGGGGKTAKVADATSLQYTVDVTYNGTTTLAKFAGENLGTPNMLLRVDLSGSGSNWSLILNGTDQTAWQTFDGNWTDISTSYNDIMTSGCGIRWNANVDALANWSGTGDCTYTDSATATTFRIYKVVINPTLDASLFQHTQ
jgi:predicted permease